MGNTEETPTPDAEPPETPPQTPVPEKPKTVDIRPLEISSYAVVPGTLLRFVYYANYSICPTYGHGTTYEFRIFPIGPDTTLESPMPVTFLSENSYYPEGTQGSDTTYTVLFKASAPGRVRIEGIRVGYDFGDHRRETVGFTAGEHFQMRDPSLDDLAGLAALKSNDSDEDSLQKRLDALDDISSDESSDDSSKKVESAPAVVPEPPAKKPTIQFEVIVQ